MYCTNCGKKLEPEDKFCVYCGAKRDIQQNPSLTNPDTQSKNNDQESDNNSEDNNHSTWGIVGGVITVIYVIAKLYLMNR
ncbi:zinc ribbon domain-containing protein [Companilactobacillus sp.]|uniref:zinc ribbon domain-containing protein n=1 Tax=Companilactobacillus sp. TaxID=2767905 RepID=UPI00260CD88A|nr:zinc ribbon domain-containing protein [Companilactobacillus sp.]